MKKKVLVVALTGLVSFNAMAWNYNGSLYSPFNDSNANQAWNTVVSNTPASSFNILNPNTYPWNQNRVQQPQPYPNQGYQQYPQQLPQYQNQGYQQQSRVVQPPQPAPVINQAPQVDTSSLMTSLRPVFGNIDSQLLSNNTNPINCSVGHLNNYNTSTSNFNSNYGDKLPSVKTSGLFSVDTVSNLAQFSKKKNLALISVPSINTMEEFQGLALSKNMKANWTAMVVPKEIVVAFTTELYKRNINYTSIKNLRELTIQQLAVLGSVIQSSSGKYDMNAFKNSANILYTREKMMCTFDMSRN